ncbi:MAG: sigma-70 family RNA polymerase sigma factor [Clostridia bacterium]|nr:sigma-70 family RNA polymerase sigma factor [Clostridia bacterium]
MKQDITEGEVTYVEDEKIIALFEGRDEQALLEIDRLYGRLCLTVARGITENEADAEECLNDTYLRLWNAIPPEHPKSLRAYALRTVKNLALDKLERRKAKKRAAVLLELDECIGHFADDLTDEELRNALNEFLETLERVDAVIFVRRYYYSEPVKTIAERLGCKDNAISKRLGKMRRNLRKFLTERGIGI